MFAWSRWAWEQSCWCGDVQQLLGHNDVTLVRPTPEGIVWASACLRATHSSLNQTLIRSPQHV